MNITRVIIEIMTCANTSKVFSHKRTELLIVTFIKPLKISGGGLLTDILLFTNYKEKQQMDIIILTGYLLYYIYTTNLFGRNLFNINNGLFLK
jgi:hypothetical protein